MACTSRNLAKAGPRFRRQSFEAGQAGVASCPCRMPRRVAAGAAPAAEAAAEAAADAENEHADEEDGVAHLTTRESGSVPESCVHVSAVSV